MVSVRSEPSRFRVEASLVKGAWINEVAERYGIRANLLTAWRRRYAASVEAPKRKKTQVRSLPSV